jgi:hypothetical protein
MRCMRFRKEQLAKRRLGMLLRRIGRAPRAPNPSSQRALQTDEMRVMLLLPADIPIAIEGDARSRRQLTKARQYGKQPASEKSLRADLGYRASHALAGMNSSVKANQEAAKIQKEKTPYVSCRGTRVAVSHGF